MTPSLHLVRDPDSELTGSELLMCGSLAVLLALAAIGALLVMAPIVAGAAVAKFLLIHPE